MPARYLHTDADLKKAMRRLVKADPRLAPIADQVGAVSVRRREAGFAGLCAIVTSQQVSTASAAAIWGRLSTAFDPFHHDPIRQAHPDTLAGLGLSKPKIKTIKAIGTAIAKGEIDLDALAHMEADEAHAALVTLHGIGPWTADIYLLFCLGHADAFPAGDLALQEAARMAFNMRARPDAKKLTQIADAWRPWRGVAAHLLWAYYKNIKRRDPAPVDPKKTTGDPNGR